MPIKCIIHSHSRKHNSQSYSIYSMNFIMLLNWFVNTLNVMKFDKIDIILYSIECILFEVRTQHKSNCKSKHEQKSSLELLSIQKVFFFFYVETWNINLWDHGFSDEKSINSCQCQPIDINEVSLIVAQSTIDMHWICLFLQFSLSICLFSLLETSAGDWRLKIKSLWWRKNDNSEWSSVFNTQYPSVLNLLIISIENHSND